MIAMSQNRHGGKLQRLWPPETLRGSVRPKTGEMGRQRIGRPQVRSLLMSLDCSRA